MKPKILINLGTKNWLEVGAVPDVKPEVAIDAIEQKYFDFIEGLRVEYPNGEIETTHYIDSCL